MFKEQGNDGSEDRQISSVCCNNVVAGKCSPNWKKNDIYFYSFHRAFKVAKNQKDASKLGREKSSLDEIC